MSTNYNTQELQEAVSIAQNLLPTKVSIEFKEKNIAAINGVSKGNKVTIYLPERTTPSLKDRIGRYSKRGRYSENKYTFDNRFDELVFCLLHEFAHHHQLGRKRISEHEHLSRVPILRNLFSENAAIRKLQDGSFAYVDEHGFYKLRTEPDADAVAERLYRKYKPLL